jgi:HAD superfamily hydrolase (TIGR01509 family)
MIRALVFDFDGLIIDTETPIIEAWAALHIEAGLPYTKADAAKIVGHVGIPFDPWAAFPPDVERTRLEDEHRKRSRAILAHQSLLPGVHTLLTTAREAGLLLGVASNSTHLWVDNHLKRLGLFDLFSAIKCRDDVAQGKPEPEVYLAVTAALGISPSEAVAFEDSTAGSMAAKRAGLWCVAVPNPSTLDHDFSHVDLKLNTLAETSVPDLLQRFGK